MTKIICPACGYDRLIPHKKRSFDTLTLGPSFSFEEVNYECESCHEEGDFSGETEKNYLEAEKEAQTKFLEDNLEILQDKGVGLAAFERIFELPARTLTRWKNGDFSAVVLAFIRIIITYPWIIEVAEHKFESRYAKLVLINAATKKLMQLSKQSESLQIKSGDSSVEQYSLPRCASSPNELRDASFRAF